jgi:hypothetical protein
MDRMATMDEKLLQEGNDKRNVEQIEPDRWFDPAF